VVITHISIYIDLYHVQRYPFGFRFLVLAYGNPISIQGFLKRLLSGLTTTDTSCVVIVIETPNTTVNHGTCERITAH
jgi:hypothetical protein